MTGSDARRLATLLALEYERMLQQPALAAEVQRARREFFGAMAPAPAGTAQQRRFCEWLLLERASQTLGSEPWLLADSLQDEALFEDSLAGLFLVEGVVGGQTQLRDLQDDNRFDACSEEHNLLPGDLVIGRLYSRGDGSKLPSAAVVVFRPGRTIAAAFERDLERLELQRRLSQQELEQLLQVHGGQPQLQSRQDKEAHVALPQLEHLEAELEQLLQHGGATLGATEITRALQSAPRFGPVAGALLEQLAFDTRVDLDAVRAQLLLLWNVLHPTPEAAAPSVEVTADADDEDLGDRLVRTLDQGLAQGRDLEELFAEIEGMAGIESTDEDDEEPGGDFGEELDEDDLDDDDRDTADYRMPAMQRRTEVADLTRGELIDLDPSQGDLAVLIQEYLWETSQQRSPAAATLQTLLELQQQNALPHTDLEAITGADLVRLLLHVFLRTEPARRAATVHAAYAAVAAFFAWAETTQEYQLQAPLQGCRDSLVQHVDRLADLGQHLSELASASGKASPPCLMRVEDVGRDGFGVRLDAGDSWWIDADAALLAKLRVGDLLLAAILPQAGGSGKLAGMVVALPQDAEHLIG